LLFDEVFVMQSLQHLIENSGDVARPFWTALAEGRIDLPHCRSCDRLFFYPRRFCPHCHASDIGAKPASGRGTVFAVSVIHVPFPGVEADELPLATGLVDLAEGVRMPARFDAEKLPKVGEAVTCHFDGPKGFPIFLPEDRR
jgi:uncharacterized OB-fold protein